MSSAPGIYVIRNINNGKVYVGSSLNVLRRWHSHKSALRSGRSTSTLLQRAWNAHGEEAFKFEVLELIDDVAMLAERETAQIASLRSMDPKFGYNLLAVGGSARGFKHSDETRARMSRAQLAIPIEKRLAYCKSFSGRRHSDETRAKMSAAAKGRTVSPEARAKIGAAQRGKTISPENRRRVSEAQTGRILTPEERAKISAKLKGRVFTPEWRAKLSAASKRRHAAKAQLTPAAPLR